MKMCQSGIWIIANQSYDSPLNKTMMILIGLEIDAFASSSYVYWLYYNAQWAKTWKNFQFQMCVWVVAKLPRRLKSTFFEKIFFSLGPLWGPSTRKNFDFSLCGKQTFLHFSSLCNGLECNFLGLDSLSSKMQNASISSYMTWQNCHLIK